MAPLDSLPPVQTRLARPPEPKLTRRLVWIFAAATGVIIMNLSAAQPLLAPIAHSIGLSPGASGLISTLPLLGYAVGLIFLVPLADLVENRRLILMTQTAAVLAAGATAMIAAPTPFLAGLFLLGAACCSIQMLVPLAASMAPPEARGRVVGDVMSGVMVGILLSRPLASISADTFGWRSFYVISAVLMAALALILARNLPERRPHPHLNYGQLLASLWSLLRHEPVLRMRSFTAALGLAAFSAFWTAIALRLAEPPFALDQLGIAVFALVGATAALVAPIAGRLGDRGWSFPATVVSHVMIVVGFAVANLGGAGSEGNWIAQLALLAVAAAFLDIGVVGDQTIGRRAVNLLNPEARGRLNALFVGIFFIGGALGAAVTGLAWSWGGWPAVCTLGASFGVAALLADLGTGPSERRL
jgi:predicted MFS family arabinose efflux permease